MTPPSTTSAESATRERYAAAAAETEPALCCPVDYDPEYLKAIPAEVIEKDYGCGDPSKHLRPGETVLDLGSGTGKICFIASQVVGPEGKVIGVDMTDDMLEVARRNAPVVAENRPRRRSGQAADRGALLLVGRAAAQTQPRHSQAGQNQTFHCGKDGIETGFIHPASRDFIRCFERIAIFRAFETR
jgi:SAM-dependent methyltransferase